MAMGLKNEQYLLLGMAIAFAICIFIPGLALVGAVGAALGYGAINTYVANKRREATA